MSVVLATAAVAGSDPVTVTEPATGSLESS
jgi:hypothetical protein